MHKTILLTCCLAQTDNPAVNMYYMDVFLLYGLQFIPMPVLYGVFLYMGVASLNGVQVSCCTLLRHL